jgi:nicotinate-nucleotide adenylyltransferase
MKIGILGGTFDPIHEGHLALARCAKEQFQLDKVIFIPAFIPPHKMSQRDLTPAEYRYRMVEMAIAGEAGLEVSKMELDRPEVSYTVETLRELKKQYAGAQFFLILGTDSLAEISSWREPGEIMRMAKLLVGKREGAEHFTFPKGPQVEWIQMPLFPFSSTEIRKRIREGEPVESMIPKAIQNYIRDRKLYLKG